MTMRAPPAYSNILAVKVLSVYNGSRFQVKSHCEEELVERPSSLPFESAF